MAYELRHHPRARRLRLRVERDGTLVVTAPKRLSRGEIDRFVKGQAAWIARVRERLARARAERDPAFFGMRPAGIDLPAVRERWLVVYGEDDVQGVLPHLRLPDDEAQAATAGRLQDWLKRHARRSLTPRLEEAARAHGFEYKRLSFRNQRSRWGSCSSSGSLSFNARLLFCSPEACHYVLIHELVHLEHPNHSPRFWQRVAELCPGYRQHVRELKTVWNRLPDWVTAS
jgi:hypothetical protein